MKPREKQFRFYAAEVAEEHGTVTIESIYSTLQAVEMRGDPQDIADDLRKVADWIAPAKRKRDRTVKEG